MKDDANIYDLPIKQFDEYWCELSPGAQNFAECILECIKTKELPYIMSIEGKFGSGKTHFATRLCEYLKKEKITSIYVSAFEHDYISNPLTCITQTIYKAFRNKSSNDMKQLFYKFIRNTTVGMRGFGVNLDIPLKELFPETDPVQEFKKYLSQQIKQEENGRLVLIIDELDRCKQDFSISLIEAFKPFFNIDGLFVIFVFNSEFLLESLKGTYGSKFGDNIDEHYIDKFVNSRMHMFIPTESEYENIVFDFIKDIPYKLSEKLHNKDHNQYLPSILIQYKLSLRQARSVCELIIEYYRQQEALPEKEELFIHLVCRKILNKDFTNIDSLGTLEEKNESSRKRETLFDVLHKNDNAYYRDLHNKYGYFETDYKSFFKYVKAYANFLCKDAGVAESFSESYLSELCEEMEKRVRRL